MTRIEFKNYAITMFGFEHPITVLIFKIDEMYEDDATALALMEIFFREGMKKFFEEEA